MENYNGWGRSAWWRFIASEDVELSVNLLQSTNPDDTWARLFLWQGPELGQLNYVDVSDTNDYVVGSSYGDLPEIIYTVTAGETYHVQAILRDGYPDMTYVLQIGTITLTETAWLAGGTYQQLAGSSPTNNITFNGPQGAISTHVTAYTLEPNPETLDEAAQMASTFQFIHPFFGGETLPHVSVAGTFHGNAPNPDYNGINSPILANMSRYLGQAHSTMYGQRRLNEVANSYYFDALASPPAGAFITTVEPGIPKVLGLSVDFDWLVQTYDAGAQSSSVTSSVFYVRAMKPPADDGTETNDLVALQQNQWDTSFGAGTVIFTHGAGNESARITVDLTPYISDTGGYLIREYLSGGAWGPTEFDTIYDVNMSAQFIPVAKTYTLQAPRVKYTVRTVGGDGVLPVITGRPDLVRRRFVYVRP